MKNQRRLATQFIVSQLAELSLLKHRHSSFGVSGSYQTAAVASEATTEEVLEKDRSNEIRDLTKR